MPAPLSFVSRAMFRAALACCPVDFRQEHGQEVLDTLATREAERRQLGRSLVAFRTRESWALIRAARRLRRTSAPPRPLALTGVAPMLSFPCRMFAGLSGDLRFGARGLVARPGYAAVAVLTLAVACGAAIAVFSVLNAVILQPLPYHAPDRLVVVRDASPPRFPSFSVSPGRYLAWEQRARLYDGFAATRVGLVTLTGSGDPEQLDVTHATANTFDLLGAVPLLGRTFTVDEDRPGAADVVVLSESLWRARFGGDEGIVGRILTFDGNPVTVVGVMPATFEYPSRAVAAWLPMAFTDDERQRYGSHYLRVVGRMSEGVTIDAARDDLARAARELEQDIPGGNEAWITLVDPLHEYTVKEVRSGLILLALAGVGVLLIACANVAGLLLARGADRAREIALRAALGASRWRLVRQLLAESGLLGAAGAVGGLVLAVAALRVMLAAPWTALPRITEVPVDLTTVIFASVLALVIPMAIGALPALQLASPASARALAVGARTGASSLRTRTRAVLIVGEIALAVMLVSGSALLVRSLDRLMQVDPGFRPDGVLAATVTTPGARYASDEERMLFLGALLERAAALPGITSVASTQSVPFFGDYVASLVIDGDEEPESPFPSANFYAVTPAYFETMGVRVLQGRDFTPADDANAPRVAVVSEQLALRVFGRPDVVGRLIRPSQGPRSDFAEIVGVVDDVRHYGLDGTMGIQIYEPARQHPYFSTRHLVVRTAVPLDQATAMVRRTVLELDPLMPVSNAEAVSTAVAASTGSRRFTTALLGGLAAVALLLAAVGVYALVTFSVGRRIQEFGVRIALGAEPSAIMRLVLRQGLTLALVGVAIGLAGTLAAGRLLDALLFEVSASDPVALGVASLVLLLAATLASAAPALRALRLDPVTALRQS